MSSSSFCLLVLLGAVLASGKPLHHDPEDLTQIMESLANALDLKNSDVSAHSPFKSVVESINVSCLKKEDFQLVNVTLDVYLQILSSILEHSDETPSLLDQVADRSQVEQDLLKLQHKMEEKKRHLSQQNHRKHDVLRDLHRINVDEPLVQKRALAAFREINQMAYLVGKTCGAAH